MHDLLLSHGTVHDGFGTPAREVGEPQPYKLHQGVTTEIIGNCGFSCGPADPETSGIMPAELAGEAFATFGDSLNTAQAAGPSNNLAVLVGHNTP
ncbi:hypothetical protein [Microtetraspora sp. NBRC 16547]|uniref:hypothetical protein n=1 Tax=Microtetraspora sp. NBRC 16547 TaxID=3030993 RepID=UPI0024A06B16|nr:hypothetical protein [Microtetraspora sp. NBRC 16547]GLX02371.1 hypothetical protein Misp02_64570 [Microtetraspora sp. NBRC 16547]